MDIVKRYLFLIILGAVTLVATVMLYLRYQGLQDQAREMEGRLDQIVNLLETFRRSPYALQTSSLEQMRRNEVAAREHLEGLKKSLAEKYPGIEFTDNMTPINTKLHIDSQCEAMRQRLGLRRIVLDPSLQWFGFDEWRNPNIFPRGEQIPQIRKHLEIISEIVNICQRTPVSGVMQIERLTPDMNMVPIDQYGLAWCQYRVVVTGNIGQVQRFLESVSDSRYLFIVSQMNITANDEFGNVVGKYPSAEDPAGATPAPGAGPGPGGMPGMGPGGGMPGMPGMPGMGPGGMPRPGAGPAAPAPAPRAAPARRLTREERLVMPNLVTLRLEVVLDYLEFSAVN